MYKFGLLFIPTSGHTVSSVGSNATEQIHVSQFFTITYKIFFGGDGQEKQYFDFSGKLLFVVLKKSPESSDHIFDHIKANSRATVPCGAVRWVRWSPKP